MTKKKIDKNNKIITVFLLIINVSLLINKVHKINTERTEEILSNWILWPLKIS